MRTNHFPADVSALRALAVPAALLAILHGAGAAAAQAPVNAAGPSGAARPAAASTRLTESAIARARRAAELRDSAQRVNADLSAAVQGNVRQFLEDPYGKPPPTLAQLDEAIAPINARLRAARVAAGNQGASPEQTADLVGTAAALAGGTAGLMDPMTLAVGVTDFVVERAKDEVAFSFVLNLRRLVRNDDLIRVALPRSHGLMLRMDTESFQSFMPLLRSAMVEDLNELPTHHNGIADALGLNATQRTYLQGVSIAYARGLEIRRGTAPAVALSNLMDVDATEMADAGTRRALRMVGLLAREYAAGGGEPLIQALTERDRGWVRRYFVAFLAHDLLALEGFKTEDLTAPEPSVLMNYLASREADAVLLLNQLHTARDALGRLGGEGKEGDDETSTADGITAAAGAVLEVLRTAPRFAYLPGDSQSHVQGFQTFVADATLLHQALTRRDFGSVVTWLVQNPNLRLCTGSNQASCDARLKYLSFAASLAAARNAEEVTTALRTASSPVGSFRVKRSQHGEWFMPRTASLVGYLGGGWYASDSGGDGGDDSHAGIALPLGPEVSFGTWWGAVSLFVPLVDLGPVANQRLGWAEDDADELEVEDIFSPGLAVVFNLTRSFPISAGVGIQSARAVRDGADGPEEYNVARSIVFIGVDATLFHFRF